MTERGCDYASYYIGFLPLNKEQKQQLVSELTAVASKITKIPEGAFVVYLREHDRNNIGSGGKLLSESSK